MLSTISNINIDVCAQRVKTTESAGSLTQDSLNTSQTFLLATTAALEEPNFRKLAPICLRMLMSLYLLGNLMGWLQGRERATKRFHLHDAKRLGAHINC